MNEINSNESQHSSSADIQKEIDAQNYLKAADMCRNGLIANPYDSNILSAFAELEDRIDPDFYARLHQLLNINDYAGAIDLIKQWLKIVGERNDLLEALEDVVKKRRSYTVAQQEIEEKKARDLRESLEKSLLKKDIKSAYQIYSDLKLISVIDSALKDSVLKTIKEAKFLRKKMFRKLILWGISFMSIGIITLISSMLYFSSDIGFLIGLIILGFSFIITLIIIILSVLPSYHEKLIQKIKD